MFGSFFKHNKSIAEESSSQSIKLETESAVNQTENISGSEQMNQSICDKSTEVNKGSIWMNMRFNRRLWDNEESSSVPGEESFWQKRKEMRKEFMRMREKLRSQTITEQEFEEYKKSMFDKWQSMHGCWRSRWNNTFKSDNQNEAGATEKETTFKPSIGDTTLKFMSGSTKLSIRA